MTSRDFAYWLQGFFELADPKNLTDKQVETIKNHLNMVFHHEIDPAYGKDRTVLQQIHQGKLLTERDVGLVHGPDAICKAITNC